jgi:hypothetical protein
MEAVNDHLFGLSRSGMNTMAIELHQHMVGEAHLALR